MHVCCSGPPPRTACLQEIEETKKKVQDQLKVLREENDEAMFEFRANRKLGVQLRDLVAEGKVEEAQKLAAEQVRSQADMGQRTWF